MPISYMEPFSNVYAYLEFCEHPDLSRIRPQECVSCGRKHPLNKHDQFERDVFYGKHRYRITLFRFRCGACSKTVTVYPSFIGRYQRCMWGLQEEVLLEHEDGKSLEQAGEAVPYPSGPISSKTIWRWSKRWMTWMELIEPEFWRCVLTAKPTLEIPRGRDRPAKPIALWKQIWCEALPMGVSVGLFQGLSYLRHSNEHFAS